MEDRKMDALYFAASIGGREQIMQYGKTYRQSGIEISLEKENDKDRYTLLKPRLKCTVEKSGKITDINSVKMTLKCAETPRLRTLNGDNCSKDSFLPVIKDIEDGCRLSFSPSGGRSSNTTAFPFFDITLKGVSYLFAVGWSGQWHAEISRNGCDITLQAGIENADFYMNRGEEFALPTIMIVRGDDRFEVLKTFRNLMRTKYKPLPEGMDHLPVSVQPFDRYFRRNPEWTTEEGQLKTIENASRCGSFDTLWIDAAWFTDGFPTGVGNYSIQSGFPNGLMPISQAAHKAGMRFMVWFEPERIYRGSEVWRDHPDYLLSNGDENTFLYDLGNEEAWKWLYDTLRDFISQNGIDNYRQDFNMDPLSYWLQNDEPGRKGIKEIKYINGLYRLWDALRSDFPYLMIDDCSSGGRRIDFETMRRSVPMWRSDITCGPITDTAHNDVWNQNQTLGLAEYLPFHACACWEPIANDIRSAATAGLACTFDFLNPDFDFDAGATVLKEVARHAAEWKNDFIPLTEASLDESVWCAWQIAGSSSGFAEFFRRAESGEKEFVFKPYGIFPDRDYVVTFIDEKYRSESKTISGSEFMRGIKVICPEAHTSAVIEYQEIH